MRASRVAVLPMFEIPFTMTSFFMLSCVCHSGSQCVAGSMYTQKKRESRTCCPFHNRRLWYCPSSLNEQTCRSLTQNMPCVRIHGALAQESDGIVHIHISHLPFAAFLTKIEIYQISDCQERASSKRFSSCRWLALRQPVVVRPLPHSPVDRASA